MNFTVALLDKANAFLKSNDLNCATTIYKQVIQIDPENLTALNTLGLIYLKQNIYDEAVYWLKRALTVDSKNEFANSNIGFIYSELGNYQKAIEHLTKALEANPKQAYFWNDIGDVFSKSKNLPKAAECYKMALQLDDKQLGSLLGLAVIAVKNENFEDAISYYKKALSLDDNLIEAHLALGAIFMGKGILQDAAKHFEAVLSLGHSSSEIHKNLGLIYFDLKNYQNSIKYYIKSISLNPDDIQPYECLAYIYLHKIRDIENALYYTKKVLSLDENHETALRLLAEILHITGNLTEAFQLHVKNRYSVVSKGYNINIYKIFQSIPLWDGGNFFGKRLIIGDHESFGGYGDIFQFFRYLPLVKKRGGHVTLPVKKNLLRLLEGCGGFDELIIYDENSIFPENFDLHIPFMNLPIIFDTSLDNIPGEIPYLRVCPELIDFWKTKLIPDNNLKVGLVWSPNNPFSDKNCGLKALQPLNNIDRITYYSLQVGWASKEAQLSDISFDIVDLTGQIRDFADTAAIIENLDLVISVDTGVAHLAGALGKPVWLILPMDSECRWLLERNDSPWYPTMRLFRSKVQKSFDAAIREIRLNLERLAKKTC